MNIIFQKKKQQFSNFLMNTGQERLIRTRLIRSST